MPLPPGVTRHVDAEDTVDMLTRERIRAGEVYFNWQGVILSKKVALILLALSKLTALDLT